MMKAYKNLAFLSLALLLAAAPTFSYAKENDGGLHLGLGANVQVSAERKVENKNERENRDRDEHKGFVVSASSTASVSEHPSKSCFKAFGHLIAKGFIKNKGKVGVDFWKDCFVPRGILQKLGGHGTSTATSTIDVTAPTISNVSVVSGTTTALIGWKTNENASSTLYYGTSSPLSLSLSSNIFRKVNTVMIPNLSASTTYYFRIQAADKSGNATTSTEASFSTR